MADCIFCRIATGEIPATIVDQDADTLAFEDLTPQAPVHVLVIPRAHTASVRELDDSRLLAALLATGHRVAASRGLGEGGYRLVFNVGPDAGQSVFHTHLHVLGGRRMRWPPG